LSSLALGCSGLLSGSGSVIADLQARLFRAVRANDLATRKQINDRIWPTAEAFYSEPWVDMHNRMKEALVMMGKLRARWRARRSSRLHRSRSRESAKR